MAFSGDQHEKQVAKFIKKSTGEMTKSDADESSAQLLKKDDMVNAGLTSYDKTEVCFITLLLSFCTCHN